MNKQEHVYRVSFHDPLPDACDGKTDFFFTSIAAIYDRFSREDIGCKVSRLWNLKISGGNTYDGRLCTISREPIFRMKHTAPTGGYKL